MYIFRKHKLEKLKSPLLDDLMNCLRELMKDYKNEVKEILAADKQLATEIQSTNYLTYKCLHNKLEQAF